MRAHIVHDVHGSIISVIIENESIPGGLEVQSEQAGELVTAVDLDETFAQRAVEEDDKDHQSLIRQIARDIRSGFRVEVAEKRLRRLDHA